MIRRLLCLGLLAGLLGIACQPALALELVYPEDGTFVVRSDYVIIKGGEAPVLDAMMIEINGVGSDPIDISGADYRAAFGDFLILQPVFDPGENRIRVEGYAAGKKVAEVKAKVYFQAKFDSLPPASYRPYVMHLPEREKLCAGCHNMTPDKVELQNPSGQVNPCASCHARMLDKGHVHGPAGVYRCADCHDPASRPSRYQIKSGSDADLCNACHQEQLKSFESNKFVHGPVAAGMCLICHDAHASDQPAQVVAPINEVCLACHATIAKGPHVTRGVGGDAHPLSGKPDPSRVGRELSCSSCHNPHGGNSRSYFQRGQTSRFALCQMCHQK